MRKMQGRAQWGVGVLVTTVFAHGTSHADARPQLFAMHATYSKVSHDCSN